MKIQVRWESKDPRLSSGSLLLLIKERIPLLNDLPIEISDLSVFGFGQLQVIEFQALGLCAGVLTRH